MHILFAPSSSPLPLCSGGCPKLHSPSSSSKTPRLPQSAHYRGAAKISSGDPLAPQFTRARTPSGALIQVLDCKMAPSHTGSSNGGGLSTRSRAPAAPKALSQSPLSGRGHQREAVRDAAHGQACCLLPTRSRCPSRQMNLRIPGFRDQEASSAFSARQTARERTDLTKACT